MNTKTKLLLALALIACGVAGRLLPHAWNFAPITAIGLFAGARLGKRYALTLPIITMLASDIFIGFYDWRINLTVYAAMTLSGVIGIALRTRRNPLAIGTGSIIASLAFFLVTNGAVWAWSPMYTHNANGLFASYIAGLPFLRNALVGDMWYTLIFFGAYELVTLAYVHRKEIMKYTTATTSKIS